ncbi:hypothetical protein Are01nite_32590 [Actinoplanes regularis]|nr:hypothetical protein Are01nite_32590 [Actinoplanes regularis]
MDHQGERPRWDCNVCGEAWPCSPAREHLVGAMNPTELRTLMWGLLEKAARELPPVSAPELFERFLHWTPQIREASR